MGVLANHVPSIEQLKPGLVEVVEESGGAKQFFCTSRSEWEQTINSNQ
jgi:F0F1-type ATP synthase epsilon subunit